MKLALITDTHAGARNDSIVFNDYFLNFYQQQFFPILKERNIDTIVHLGDLFDRRKFINFHTLSTWKKHYFEPSDEFNCHFIVGNHDVYYKNSNDVASTDLLLREYNFVVYDEPQEVVFDELNVLFMPWINSENYKNCMNTMENSKAQVMFGHFEVKGFEMHRGSYCNTGMSRDIFSKFDIVISGHFHHKSDNGTLFYLGTPYELTWQDYSDQKGFHIFDTDTRLLEFIPNKKTIYKKIYYDDEDMNFEDVANRDYSEYENTFVKVVVKKKSDAYLLERLIQKLEENNTANVTIIDNALDIFFDGDVDDMVYAEDTMTIVSKYIESLEDSNINKNELDNLMRELYSEALQSDFNIN